MSLADLLKKHSDVLSLQSNNRIKCSVTGHEMPPNVEAVQNHLEGKKFRKALEWYSRDYSQYLPWIIAHKNDHTKLFCTLTRIPLNKIPGEVEKHVNGKNFLRLQKKFEEKQKGQDAKAAKKLAREKEREEAEKMGIWVPSKEILGNDMSDDEDDDIDEADEEDELDQSEEDNSHKVKRRKDDDAMDESSDEEWIITTAKLKALKKNGIAEDSQGMESNLKRKTKNGANMVKSGTETSTGKRIVKPIKQNVMQSQEAKPAKRRG